MTIAAWLRPPRHPLTSFLVMTGSLAVGLAWLGWQVVDLDRRLEHQRTQERLGHALDVVALSLTNWLADIDHGLARVASESGAPPLSTSLPDGAIVVVLDQQGISVLPQGSLAFYPEPLGEISRAAEPASFNARTTPGNGLEPTTRALALLREAAAFRRQGRPERALASYDELSRTSLVLPVLDAPADIVALHARCLTLAALGRPDDLREGARRRRTPYTIRDEK